MFINSTITLMFQDITMVQIQEISSLKHVSIYTGIMTSGYSVGGIIYALLFMGIKKWEYISYINIGIGVLTTVFIFIFCLDSFSDMVDDGKIDQFKNSLKFIANINGVLEDYEKETNTKEYREKMSKLFGEKFIEEEKKQNEGTKAEKMELKDSNKNLNEMKEMKENKMTLKENNQVNNNIESNTKKVAISDKNNLETEENLRNEEEKEEKEDEEINKATFCDIFRYASVRYIFIAMCLLFVLNNFVYYGLTIGVKNLPGNIYVNNILLNCVEIPTYFIVGYMMQIHCLGRKKTDIIYTGVVCVACLLLFIFYDYDTLSIVLYLVARAFSNGAYVIIITFGFESYPKSVANLAYGINGVFYGLGGIAVSFVGEYVHTKTLYLIFFIVAAANTALLFYPPETFNNPAPTQIKEIVEMRKKNTENEVKADNNGENKDANNNNINNENKNELISSENKEIVKSNDQEANQNN